MLTNLSKYILLVGDDNKNFSFSGPGTTMKHSSTPSELNFNDMNISFNNIQLNDNSLKKEIYTKHNLLNYFPGCGRDISGSDLAQTNGLLVYYKDGSGIALPGSSSVTLTNIDIQTINNISVGSKVTKINGILDTANSDCRVTEVDYVNDSLVIYNYGSVSSAVWLAEGNFTLQINKNYGHADTIGEIPFCIEPTNYTQPTGCVSTYENMVNHRLIINYTKPKKNIIVFVVGYNIIYIQDGQCSIGEQRLRY